MGSLKYSVGRIVNINMENRRLIFKDSFNPSWCDRSGLLLKASTSNSSTPYSVLQFLDVSSGPIVHVLIFLIFQNKVLFLPLSSIK